MSLYVIDAILISLWIGVCSAVPEVLWQGGKALLAHGDLANLVIPSILVGLFLTFFVEPLTERLRSGSVKSHHEARHNVFAVIAGAIVLGFVTVCLHECIAAMMHSKTGLRYPELDGPQEALRIAVQWAFIPTCMTLIWLIGLRHRWAGCLLTVAAWPAIIAVSLWWFQWGKFEAVSSATIATSASLAVILTAGSKMIRATPSPFLRMALPAGIVFTISLGVMASLTAFLPPKVLELYALGDDLRFYLGWMLGLVFVPAPGWMHGKVFATRSLSDGRNALPAG